MTDNKPTVARDSTMAATAKQAKQILGKEADKLGDTRAVTGVMKKSAAGAKVKRASTLQKVAEEAKAFLGHDVAAAGERKLRVRRAAVAAPAAKKASPKRAGTMKTTAKEGKAFLKGKK